MRECQAQAVVYGLRHPYCILGLDPGLGKSRVAIQIKKRRGKPCVVVCPSYLVLNWVDQIQQWAPKNTYTAIKKGSEIPTQRTSDFTIMSYELAQKAEHLFDGLDLLVLDESHLIKSIEAKRSQFIHRVVYENSIPSVIQLTGTPIKNRTAEFWSLLTLCNYNPNTPDSPFLETYPDSITFADHFSFRHEYTLPVGNRFVKILKWTGIRRIDELKKWLKGNFLRIKADSVLDVPVFFKDVIVGETADPALAAAFAEHFEKEENRSINPAAKAEAALRKAPITAKYVESLLEETDCCLVYTDHVASCEAIAAHFDVTALHGGVPAARRMEAAQAFQKGEGKVLVATIGSLSTGVTLTRANQLVINDICWVPGDLKQTYHRINRLGQEKPCTIHRMIGSPQDLYIYQAIQEKLSVIEKAT